MRWDCGGLRSSEAAQARQNCADAHQQGHGDPRQYPQSLPGKGAGQRRDIGLGGQERWYCQQYKGRDCPVRHECG